MRYRKNKYTFWLWKLLIFALFLIVAGVFWITKTQYGEVIGFMSLIAGLGQWLLPVKNEVPVSSPPPSNPESLFFANVPLQDPKEFFGRESIRNTLIDRIRKESSTSIVGSYKVGKTWLISYLELVANHQFKQKSLLISHIDPKLPRCATLALSLAEVLTKFGVPLQGNETVAEMLRKLQDKVQDLRGKGVVPILYIEGFERFCGVQDFSLGALESLRAIAERGLVLITSSRSSLINILLKVVGKDAENSPFYNIFEELRLEPFNAEEAQEFIDEKGIEAQFTKREKELLLKYGQKGNQQWPPLRLQLLGKMLWEAKGTSDYHLEEPDYLLTFLEQFEKKYQSMGG